MHSAADLYSTGKVGGGKGGKEGMNITLSKYYKKQRERMSALSAAVPPNCSVELKSFNIQSHPPCQAWSSELCA